MRYEKEEKEVKMTKTVGSASFDRRAFLQGSAAGAAALMGLSLAGCSENKLVEDEDAKLAVTSNPEEGAEWFSVPCWSNCGGRCLNKVLVKDGIVLRQKTDDTHEDSWEWPQARGCIRGRSQQQKVFGADRVKYPMKRKHWSSEEPHGELRGIDEWERISWDEALDIFANELKKARELYGNQSILYFNIIMEEGYLGPVLSRFGGFTDTTSADSYGTFQFNPQLYGLVTRELNDRLDMKNSDYIVLYGQNALWAEFSSSYFIRHAHDDGIKFVFVGPEYNVTAAVTDAEWFPVRQGTDTAFLLGVAYSMLEQDESGSIVNWDFLDRCTVGFDGTHMPADATTNENFRAYVMGEYDGTPKTPEWAEKICGCPADRIAEFARIMGCQNKVAIHSCAAPARNKGSENFPQLLMTVACMGAHFGTPGNCCGLDCQYSTYDRGPTLVANAMPGYAFTFNPLAVENPVDDIIPASEYWSAILEGKYHFGGSALMGFQEGEERDIDIHVLISDYDNRLQTTEGINKGIEAFRKVDFVCSSVYWMKTDALYSDLVLPIATRWERQKWNMMAAAATHRDFALAHRQVIEPLYESKSDYWVAVELAKRLGVDWEEFLAIDEKQGWFNSISGTVFLDDDGEMKPLVVVTQEDLDRYGVEGEPHEGKISFEEFIDQGIYRVQRSEGDIGSYVAYQDFVSDPEGAPLGTASGKFEIYCQAKADYLDMANRAWPDYTPVSPLPKYLPTLEGYVESFEDWEAKIPGKYPYLVSNSHYLRRAHTENDNLPWLREAMIQPIFISKTDADEKGIKTGDIVRVWNDNGEVLRPASVTRCLMPGCLDLPHGAAVTIDPDTGIDLAGADNVLCSPNHTTSVSNNGWNNTMVNFEKYTGSIEVLPDCEWAQRIAIDE